MRKPRLEHPPATLPTPGLELAAEQGYALAHPHDAMPGAGAPTVSWSIIEHLDLHRMRCGANRDGRSSLPGVLDRVGWAALLLGLPLWVIGAAVLLQLRGATPVPATT